MNSNLRSQPNIDLERFQPQEWDDIVGNEPTIEHLKNLVFFTVFEGHSSGFNTLISGPSRGGKTAMIKHTIRCMCCYYLDPESLNPCSTCPSCVGGYEIFGNAGWENEVGCSGLENFTNPRRCKIRIINCATTNEVELDELVDEMRYMDDTLKIVYLDEVHRLHRRNLDERLLKPLEDLKVIWFASSAYIEKDSPNDQRKLDRMFQNRFSFRMDLQKPTVEALSRWLAFRCRESQLKVEEPCKENLQRIARNSNCVPGLALQVLNFANKSRKREVTRQLVENFRFSFDD